MGDLTGLQQAFVDEWFKDFNGVKAAERAGYQGSYSTLGNVASENLKKPKIIAEMNRRWSAHGMTAAEVTARYAEQARVNIATFLQPGSGAIDWDKVEEYGHLVKKVVHRKGQEAQIELHSAQHALDMIGKTLAMFTDKQAVDVTTKGESLNERGVDTKAHRRAVSLLTDAFRAELANNGHGESGGVGANEQAAARRDSK